MTGILAYGAYLPYWRIQHATIAAAHGKASGQGARCVASYDEDTTSMGVEAARAAMFTASARRDAQSLLFATTRPAYLDKTNATAIHAALGLHQDAFAADVLGSVRSSVAAIRGALTANEPALAVMSDIRTGWPSGADERTGGDGASALLFGTHEPIAEYLGGASTTAEFLDRWRSPSDLGTRAWEERFGESVYLPLATEAVESALKQTSLDLSTIDHVIVTGSHDRAVRRLRTQLAREGATVVADLTDQIGNTGAAHPGLLLAAALDHAEAQETIALIVLADGVDVLVFRTTELISHRRQPLSVEQQISLTRADLAYTKLQTWRGVYQLEPARRPDRSPPAAPPAFRSRDWKFGFVCSTCQCGTRHLPPAPVCVSCGKAGAMRPERMAESAATVATFTVDRLAQSENPPVAVGVLDFDGGGRFQCEITDVDPETVAVGQRLEMTFRRMYTANGIHNYFWKARPLRSVN